MKIIFLDFDGVLNSDKYVRKQTEFGVIIDPSRMELLKQIVDATDAKIVLSTSWRVNWSVIPEECNETGEKINKIFSDYRLKIFDKTPDARFNRAREIEYWMILHPEAENFVVLDDMLLDSPFIRGHYVKTCDFREGLDEENVKEALKILNG